MASADRHLVRLLALSIGHCMPPGEICAFALHRLGAGRAAWEYIFVNEVGAFHRWPHRIVRDELVGRYNLKER